MRRPHPLAPLPFQEEGEAVFGGRTPKIPRGPCPAPDGARAPHRGVAERARDVPLAPSGAPPLNQCQRTLNRGGERVARVGGGRRGHILHESGGAAHHLRAMPWPTPGKMVRLAGTPASWRSRANAAARWTRVVPKMLSHCRGTSLGFWSAAPTAIQNGMPDSSLGSARWPVRASRSAVPNGNGRSRTPASAVANNFPGNVYVPADTAATARVRSG